jgi:hypothetical protein
VLHPEAGRFAAGPLTEVAASTHSWGDLAPHLEDARTAAYVAQERVLRGEDLTGDPRTHPEVLEMPLSLAEWEPVYCLATYRSSYVEVAEPWTPSAPLVETSVAGAPRLDDPELAAALLDLVLPWTSESNGAARAVTVEGEAPGAIAHVAGPDVWLGSLTAGEAMQWMAWAAASGGAHGRRRGAALGRSTAWYAACSAGALEWPPAPGELEAAVRDLRWYRWEEDEPRPHGDEGPDRRIVGPSTGEDPVLREGWALRIAVEDRARGWAAALAATDVLAFPD